MSSQNNMAKESYPYKIIQSGYALSSSHKVFKSCTTPMTSQAIVSYFQCSKFFSTFTQYMSVSHGHSTMGGIEWRSWRRQRDGDSRTSTRCINGLWRCPSIDINVSEQGLPCNGCTRAISIRQLKLKLSGCASNLLAHEDLGHLRKPILGIYKPSSIMKSFPLVYESDIIRDSLS